MPTSNIQIRVDTELKENVEKILDDMGLDLRTAFRMFLKKIESAKTIPFALRKEEVDENGLTKRQQKELLKAYEESFDPKNWVGVYETVDDYIAELKKR